MLAKTVAIASKDYAWPIKEYLLVSYGCYMRQIKGQSVSSRYVADFTPLALLCLLAINLENNRYSKSECRLRH